MSTTKEHQDVRFSGVINSGVTESPLGGEVGYMMLDGEDMLHSSEPTAWLTLAAQAILVANTLKADS